jgi:hypothetical protein
MPETTGRIWPRCATSPNCEGFRLRVAWRRPSGLTFTLSRAVLAHGPRQAESSETPDSLGEIASESE